MGTVDVQLGYGFKVDADYNFKRRAAFDAEKHPDLWNFLDDQVTAQFALLDHDVERFGFDIYGHGAVFIRSSTVNWYGVGVNDIDNLTAGTEEEELQLMQAATFLGLDYKPGYIAVTSFG